MKKSKRNVIKSALYIWMNEYRNITLHARYDSINEIFDCNPYCINYDELTIPTLELLNESKDYLNEFIFYLKNTKADEMRHCLCVYLEPYIERY